MDEVVGRRSDVEVGRVLCGLDLDLVLMLLVVLDLGNRSRRPGAEDGALALALPLVFVV